MAVGARVREWVAPEHHVFMGLAPGTIKPQCPLVHRHFPLLPIVTDRPWGY